MSKNERFKRGEYVELTAPVGTLSGDPIVSGQLPAIAQTDRRTSGTFSGKASCSLEGVYDLSVKGVTNAAANIAVAEGDILYYNAAATPKINKDTTGVRFGYALGAVGSGLTATIPVKVGY
jgi:predicted RecA/RadA family phage recombinase